MHSKSSNTRGATRTVLARRVVRVQASSNKSTDFDFDAALSTMAEKVGVGFTVWDLRRGHHAPAPQFEKADNKPALLGWGVAGLSVFFFSEWLIHLPGLNFVRAYGFACDRVCHARGMSCVSMAICVRRRALCVRHWWHGY